MNQGVGDAQSWWSGLLSESDIYTKYVYLPNVQTAYNSQRRDHCTLVCKYGSCEANNCDTIIFNENDVSRVTNQMTKVIECDAKKYMALINKDIWEKPNPFLLSIPPVYFSQGQWKLPFQSDNSMPKLNHLSSLANGYNALLIGASVAWCLCCIVATKYLWWCMFPAPGELTHWPLRKVAVI